MRKRLYEIVEVGASADRISRGYDFFSTAVLVLNLLVSVLYTYEGVRSLYGALLLAIEEATVAFFAVDYVLRLISARYRYPKLSEPKALLRYVISFTGIVDMLSFLPYYLPIFFPAGTAAFRMFRVIRIFRLFRINAYYDSLNVIASVLKSKFQQLVSSVLLIVILMLASSLCMYSLEHEAQPEVFANAFSGIWWASSTLLTVGYGDIYPITTLGKLLGIIITFLGVGMVAIPTGIISAGFVEQYSIMKKEGEFGDDDDLRYIKFILQEEDSWAGCNIAELKLPKNMIVACVQRGRDMLVPKGSLVLQAGDVIVLGAEEFDVTHRIRLQEIVIGPQHPWKNRHVRDLDISRQTMLVSVQRDGRTIIPKGDTLLMEQDEVVLYTRKHISDASVIDI